jgi:hypothetical protein
MNVAFEFKYLQHKTQTQPNSQDIFLEKLTAVLLINLPPFRKPKYYIPIRCYNVHYMKTTAFCDTAPCNLGADQRFKGA